ncbi:MAG: polysaccharide deacetylase family protein [Roseburia sp.]|nr:polysaccharide deacetylase family protein [Roseburia sp.]
MKKLKNFLVAFDVFLVLVLAGLWAEKSFQNVISSYMELENVPAMQTEGIPDTEQTKELPTQIQEDTNYMELEEKKIAITFDDGPNPTYTPGLLQGLRDRNVKATFFIIGKNAEANPELIQEIQKDGHLIGNHTYNHTQLNNSNREAFKEELKQCSEAIKNITGEETLFVRPPYGSWDKEIEKELNMFPVLWDIDPRDWCSNDAGKIVETVLNQAEENSIILLHDQYDSSIAAAFAIIDRLKEEGYQFVTVDEILFD